MSFFTVKESDPRTFDEEVGELCIAMREYAASFPLLTELSDT